MSDAALITPNEDGTHNAPTQMIWALCTGRITEFSYRREDAEALLDVMLPGELPANRTQLNHLYRGIRTSAVAMDHRAEFHALYPQVAVCTAEDDAVLVAGPSLVVRPLAGFAISLADAIGPLASRDRGEQLRAS